MRCEGLGQGHQQLPSSPLQTTPFVKFAANKSIGESLSGPSVLALRERAAVILTTALDLWSFPLGRLRTL